jgi:hypothetical protein
MTCLVLFIEKTIAIADISGVGKGKVSTTGQLIPLIIGIASTIAAFRDLGMFFLREVSIRHTCICFLELLAYA